MLKNCIICEVEIPRKGKNGCGAITKRRPGDVTCSRDCARIYRRVHNYVRKNIVNHILKKINEGKEVG